MWTPPCTRDSDQLRHELAVEVLRVLGERLVEGVDEIARVLGEDHQACTPIGCRRHQFRDDREVRSRLGGRGELCDRDRRGVAGRHQCCPADRRERMTEGATSHVATMTSASAPNAIHAALDPTTTSKTKATTPTSSSATVSSAVIKAA